MPNIINRLEPVFPPELEQIMFQMAFNPRDKSTNGNMMLVAKRVRFWIRPLVYRIFDQGLAWYTNQPPFPNSEKKLADYVIKEICEFVVHLFVEKPKYDEAKDIIYLCPNLEDLACRERYLIDLWDSISTLTRLKRLSGVFIGIAHSEFQAEVFQSLTHIEILDPPLDIKDPPLESLATLRSLTHLLLNVSEDEDEYFEYLYTSISSWAQLQILILCVTEFSLDFITPYSSDNRVVFVDPSISFNDSEDWYRSALGEPDVWFHASNMMFARKHGYFKSDEHKKQPLSSTFVWLEHLTEEGKNWYISL